MPRLEDPQLEAFAHHYVEKFNGADAARTAHLTEVEDGPASHTAAAHLALMRPDVMRRVRELNDAKLRRVDASTHRVMLELSRISFSDVRCLFDEDGKLRPIRELESDPAAAVKAVKVERRRVRNGYETDLNTGKKVPMYDDLETVEIKMHDKVATLGILAKHFKIIGDEGDGINAIASALADRLNGARNRVLTRHPPQEIEDATPARLHAPELRGDANPAPLSQSGDGDRPDA